MRSCYCLWYQGDRVGNMLLEVMNVNKSFGGLQVLQNVSFHLQKGEILGLIGPNGAGKSTMFNVITGVYGPNAGTIRFRGEDLVGLRADQICRRGISRTFQLVRIFPSMTVLQNVLVGAFYGKRGDKKKVVEEALDCLEVLNLLKTKDTISAHLTYSDRRLLEIARAMATNPVLALLDEPLAGLNPAETAKTMTVIQKIRDTRGISIIWIEHKIDAVFHLCDRIVVLDYGGKIAEGVPKEIASDKKVVEAYLGEPLAQGK